MIVALNLGSKLRHAILLIATLGGGTAGALVCITALMSRAHTGRETIPLLVLCGLYTLGVAAGLDLHRETGNKRLSALFLALQIPVVQAAVLAYKFWVLGAYVLLFYPTSVEFDTTWFVGSYGELAVFGSAKEFEIGINIVPIALLIVLLSGADDASPGRSP